MWETPTFQHQGVLSGGLLCCHIFVVMRHTCQVTNQSSHGELSFHHNLHLQSSGAWAFLLSRCSERRLKIEKCSSPSYCHCCELCALKQKPGVLLEKSFYTKKAFNPNPNCRPYSSPHQVPKHKMLWHIEKGTLREVGKIDA